MSQNKFSKIIFFTLILTLAFSAFAQTKRKIAKKPVKKTVLTESQVDAEIPAKEAAKKNERPDATTTENASERLNKNVQTEKPNYVYEFSQPKFLVSKILIEHDETGRGKITFLKKDFAEAVSDPLQLSPAALERIKAAWNALNFLDSTEDYQYIKDYSHLGNMAFTLRKDGRERIAKFNWTENKDAKNLADEYRRIGQQWVWNFDITVARENQPLEAPRLLDTLDSLIKRNEISDAAQMIPALKELSNDERIPLIARNHATRIVKEIEKKAEKK